MNPYRLARISSARRLIEINEVSAFNEHCRDMFNELPVLSRIGNEDPQSIPFRQLFPPSPYYGHVMQTSQTIPGAQVAIMQRNRAQLGADGDVARATLAASSCCLPEPC